MLLFHSLLHEMFNGVEVKTAGRPGLHLHSQTVEVVWWTSLCARECCHLGGWSLLIHTWTVEMWDCHWLQHHHRTALHFFSSSTQIRRSAVQPTNACSFQVCHNLIVKQMEFKINFQEILLQQIRCLIYQTQISLLSCIYLFFISKTFLSMCRILGIVSVSTEYGRIEVSHL